MILSGYRLLLPDHKISDLYTDNETMYERPWYYTRRPPGKAILTDNRSYTQTPMLAWQRYIITYVKPIPILDDAVFNEFGKCIYDLEIIDRFDCDLLIARHDHTKIAIVTYEKRPT